MKHDILKLAARHGLLLKEDMEFNEMGIDFRVVFVEDVKGQNWVLRIPRRETLAPQIQQEKNILERVRANLSISVPDWTMVSSEFIAYPLLKNKPVITFDPGTYEVTWNIGPDRKNHFTCSLAGILCEIHRIPCAGAQSAGLKSSTIDGVRQEILEDIETVKMEIGMRENLETRWRRWVDSDEYWPGFTSFVHGDLYAGHILSDPLGNVTGMIDWSEAQISDPSMDFSGHLAVFDEQSLQLLITEYEKQGGRVWKKMLEHCLERHAASPLKYGVYALKTNLDEHIQAVRQQLG